MKENNTPYCAFLRGVNVKGTTMKMAEVCSVFEKENLQPVSSILATGNILFHSDLSRDILKSNLEKAMSEHFSYEALLFIKNKNEIEEMLKNNPFSASEHLHHYVFVAEENTEKLLAEEFSKTQHSKNERGEIIGKNFYWQVEKGNTLNTEFGKILGKRNLKNLFTSRNINTIEKILSKFD
jgi:uncharacterized protein (DUF1697 family)